MNTLLNWAGSLAALLGVVLCLGAGAMRLTGVYEAAGFELRTLFMIGTGLMVMGCVAKLYDIARLLRQTGR
jgi:hypothetical protein